MFCHFARLAFVFVCSCGVLAAESASGVWLDVPFVRQEKEGCGAASIAMVMQYWINQQGRSANETINAHEIQRDLYVSAAHGIYASAMERYLQHRGFRTFSFRGEWSDLRQHLEKGRPLIVALGPAANDRSLHYVVVAGLDLQQQLVLLNDPAQRKLLKQKRADFEKQWNSTGKWTLLALPPPSDGG